ncbi:MAG: toll/interleukin-1 receptor domain-containing protein [Alphaproteobacteria bacterium]|nr:toll/interleukin-1 receptor domain-containing protein [Alphaproteobacteria bacterium]
MTEVLPRCFVSHARWDEQHLPAVCEKVRESAGATSFFIDTEALRVGDLWELRLTEELLRADLVAIVWSRRAARSKWMALEIMQTLARRDVHAIRVLVFLADATPVPNILQPFQHHHLTQTTRSQWSVIGLAWWVGVVVGAVVTPPPWAIVSIGCALAAGTGWLSRRA